MGSRKAPHLLSVWIAAHALAQTTAPKPGQYRPEDLPCCVTRLASPDGSRTLYSAPYQPGVNNEAQLWIENTRTHQRHMLVGVPGTVSARWNADGSAFDVELHETDETLSYIYDTATLQPVDLRARILAFDPGTRRFAKGHAYFDIVRWQGTHQVIVDFHGHTDEPPPISCFTSRYGVGRTGVVVKLSRVRVSQPSLKNKWC